MKKVFPLFQIAETFGLTYEEVAQWPMKRVFKYISYLKEKQKRQRRKSGVSEGVKSHTYQFK